MIERWVRAVWGEGTCSACKACVAGIAGALALVLAACGQLASDPAPADTAASDATEGPSSAPAQPAAPTPAAPAVAAACNGEPCEPPNQCVRYAGIAGPSVPLYACGIPCGADGACPSGLSCNVIADGPRLCR